MKSFMNALCYFINNDCFVLFSLGYANASLSPVRHFGFSSYPLLHQNSVAWVSVSYTCENEMIVTVQNNCLKHLVTSLFLLQKAITPTLLGPLEIADLNHWTRHVKSKSKLPYDDGQSASLSWCQATICDL
jgi:hypothetical protein